MEKTKNNKWRRILIGVLLTFALLISALAAVGFPIYASAADGEPALVDGVYQLDSADDLMWFAELVNGGDYDANAVLTADIDMSGVITWAPIGIVDAFNFDVKNPPKPGFAGTFDGKGHVIRNLSINPYATYPTSGLFGTVSGTVKNLGMDNYQYNKLAESLDGRFGAVAGQVIVNGTVTDCYVLNSTVNGDTRVAGIIAGCNYGGTIQNCYTYKCSVKGYTTSEEERFGHIVGDNINDSGAITVVSGTVTNCYTNGARAVSTQNGNESKCEANVSAERFASGEIAYLLASNSADSPWGQTVGTDALPSLSAPAVSRYTVNNCGNEFVSYVYSNVAEENGLTIVPDHKYSLEDGKCVCGAQKAISVTVNDVPSFFDDFEEAVKSVDWKNTVAFKLYADCSVSSRYLYFPSTCDITLDLNGKIVSADNTEFRITSSAFTLMDSSEAQNGKVTGCTFYIYNDNDGEGFLEIFGKSPLFTLSSGAIEGAVPFEIVSGTVIQNGGTVSASESSVISIIKVGYEPRGTRQYILNDGLLSINWFQAESESALDLQINGGHLSIGKQGMDLGNESTITITGGTFTNGISTTKPLAEHLTLGYAFFDENGSPVSLTEGQREIAGYVTVKPCTEHDFENFYATEVTETDHTKKCAACGALGVEEPHTGGTATCNVKAICEVCGSGYGEYDYENHTEGYTTHIASNGDNTHSLACDFCGHSTTEKEDCSGGTAGCFKLAECEVCGGEYGDYGHVPTEDGLRYSSYEHFYCCSICLAVFSDEYHDVVEDSFSTRYELIDGFYKLYYSFTCTVCGELEFYYYKLGISELEALNPCVIPATCATPGTYAFDCDCIVGAEKIPRRLELKGETLDPDNHLDEGDDGICDRCGKFSFAGAGTEDEPYIVTTYAQLQAALKATENETNYIQFNNTIPSQENCGNLTAEVPFVLDMNGYKLDASDVSFTITDTVGTIQNGTLKVFDFNVNASNVSILHAEIESPTCMYARENGTLTLTDCTVQDCWLITNNATIIASDVTFEEWLWNCSYINEDGGSFTLDGVTYTESIEDLLYHTHTDANGDCICDREGDALHTDTGFDSTCDVCGENITHIEFSKVSLTLGGDIGINYFFTLGDAVLSNEAYFLVTYPDGSTERISVSDDLIGTPKGDTSGNTYYKVTARVAAKEMADDVKVELFVNEIPVKAFNYSIQQYANVIFADASSEAGLVELVKKMLNYGAASQIALGYNTDKLANSVLDESDKTVNAVDASALTGATTNGTVSGFEYQMFSCILETKTTLRQYFTLPEGSVSEYTFTIDSESVTPTQTTVEGTTMYYIDVANIAAKDMDVVHTLVITKDGETRTITCSVQSYMKAVLTKNSEDEALVDVINAMYEYGEAAKQYLVD